MTETIMPAFSQRNAEAEGKIIGNILAGYGELELELCQCLAAVNSDIDLSIRLLFQVRGEERRIHTADQIMRMAYTNAGLGNVYCEVIADMDWCRRLRNQFPHSNWYHTAMEGLCLVNLEELAKRKGPIGQLADHRKPLTLALLLEQERFFKYVQKCFWHLAEAYPTTAVRHSGPIHPLPATMQRPSMHL
jgi:hypothetical protein